MHPWLQLFVSFIDIYCRCEYMQTDDETSQAQAEGFLSLIPGLSGLSGSNSLLGGLGSSSLLGGLLGGSSRPSRPPPNRFRPQRPTRFGGRPQQGQFGRPPFRPRPPPNCGIICKRRKKREIRKKRQIQHNILRYVLMFLCKLNITELNYLR